MQIVTPLERQFELRKLGYTQKSFAIETGVHPVTIADLISGKMVSNRLMKAFSRTIGKDYREVFPEYFLTPRKRQRPQLD